MDKVVASPEQAVADIPDGATIAIAGFGVSHRFATSLLAAHGIASTDMMGGIAAWQAAGLPVVAGIGKE